MNIAQELKNLDTLTKKIHAYFGYTEDWVTIPLDDSNDQFWRLDENERGGGQVHFGDSPEEVECYCNEIYTQRFLSKWVYRGAEYTMVVVDTQTDGNKYLQIFDNSKEVKN